MCIRIVYSYVLCDLLTQTYFTDNDKCVWSQRLSHAKQYEEFLDTLVAIRQHANSSNRLDIVQIVCFV